MSTRTQSPSMTYQDLLRLPEDLLRHELIDGEHYVSPAPNRKHQETVVNLVRILSTFVRANKLGRVLVAPTDVLFSERDVVEPDVLYISAAKPERLAPNYIAGAPDLVVEVLSPSSRKMDRTKKYRLYQGYGVPEYWIVDPAAETVEVFRATTAGSAGSAGGPLAPAASLSLAAGDTLETPLLAGLRIPLAEVFE